MHSQYNQYGQNIQIQEVLSQYEMEIYEITKGRGTYICNTAKGMRVLTQFRGTKEKGAFLKEYLEKLKNAGFKAEQIELNKDGDAVTQDELTGENFIVKEYLSGTELNTTQLEELTTAVTLLATYHNISSKQEFDCVQLNLEEKERYFYKTETIINEKERHTRELIKVKNYIRSRKKKNEFERIYLKHYDAMLETAKKSIAILTDLNIREVRCGVCHGEFNQHNIVCSEGKWQIINFENFVYGWSILDLANFLRKMQEKNNWDMEIGTTLLENYTTIRSLWTEEYKALYALLLFPEKFWKVTNHYMNSRKTWISERDIEKLQKVMEQEEKRLKFLEKLFLT